MQKRNVLNSPRLSELKNRRRKVFFNKLIFVLVGLAIIFIGLGFLSRLARLNIQSFAVAGNKVVDTEVIQEKVETNLAGHYFWLFPKTNIFFYPKSKIKENLAQDFKRLEKISFQVSGDRVLEISVSEREALYTWCGEVPLAETVSGEKEKCFFLDKNGYVFDEAPNFSGDVYFKFYGKTSDSYFARENFPQLTQFKETLEGMELKPAELLIEENGNAKILLSAQHTLDIKNPEIIFKLDSDYIKLAENLSAALDADPLKTDILEKYNSLIYLDLRFGNKVYFKFR